ncbi:MAG: aminotransferase class V-fold PLP-dependent enzyme [Flavobacteriales bacterium]|nr:aminotransferase class V-fold PLP-dependent enzyme [Flavobacteriales bacterium]
MKIEGLNHQFRAYLNTPRCGLMHSDSQGIAATIYRELAEQGSERNASFFLEDMDKIRNQVGEFFGTKAANVAFLPNFSLGMNAVAEVLENSKVLVFEQEYPSVLMPLESRPLELIKFDSSDGFHFDLDQIETLIRDQGIDAFVVSHVQFKAGYMIDLDKASEICKRHNCSLIVDATQSAGIVPIDFDALKLDVLITSGYKWLNAGFGNGLGLFSEEFLDRFPPREAGFGSMSLSSNGWKYAISAKNYEPGHIAPVTLYLLEDAIRKQSQLGRDVIYKEAMRLTDYAVKKLQGLDRKIIGGESIDRASIITLTCESSEFEALVKEQIITVHMDGLLRIGVHYHNTEAEIDALCEVLSSS